MKNQCNKSYVFIDLHSLLLSFYALDDNILCVILTNHRFLKDFCLKKARVVEMLMNYGECLDLGLEYLRTVRE